MRDIAADNGKAQRFIFPTPSPFLSPPLPLPLSGAVNAELGDSGLTHLVVADTVEPSELPVTSSRLLVVKQQWFWESIQIEACADETLYQAKVSSLALLWR